MTTPDPRKVQFYFDPMCPFAYQASKWIRAVRDRVGIDIEWRLFSLEEVNRVEGKPHPWERPWSYGWSLMRIGVVLRRQDMMLLDRWYDVVGAALHERGERPHDPEVARQLLDQMGAEPSVLDEALEDQSTHAEIRTEHDSVLAAGGFGVPTLRFDNDQWLFGPVIVNPPIGDEGLRLWDLVTGWLAFPDLFELQRPKSPRDLARIADSLAPYLAGRDWVSMNRGEVISFGDRDPKAAS